MAVAVCEPVGGVYGKGSGLYNAGKGVQCWERGHKYGGPCKCGTKIKYIQPERPQSFKPVSVFKPSECQLSDGTTYKMSYYGFDPNVMRHARGQQKKLKENLASQGPFSSDTTHKMSYGAWPGYRPPNKVVPRDHRLIGDGPLSQLTTHKHDYTPKPLQEVVRTIHPGNLGFSQDRMEDKTTANMSYQFPDLNRFEPAVSFKPQQSFKAPSSKMDDKTTHKLSYQPFCPPTKEEYPWAKKDKYRSPTVKFEGDTIYNGSYFAPGQFVETTSGGDGCYCGYNCQCCNEKGEPQTWKVAHDFGGGTVCPVGFDPRKDCIDIPESCPHPSDPAPIITDPAISKPGNFDLNKPC